MSSELRDDIIGWFLAALFSVVVFCVVLLIIMFVYLLK